MKRYGYFMAGCLVTTILLLSSIAFAEGAGTIELRLGRAKLIVNGTPLAQETFLYNDTTYVPLRAVAETLGHEVFWDGADNTIYISGNAPIHPAITGDSFSGLQKLHVNTKPIGSPIGGGTSVVFRAEELRGNKPMYSHDYVPAIKSEYIENMPFAE